MKIAARRQTTASGHLARMRLLWKGCFLMLKLLGALRFDFGMKAPCLVSARHTQGSTDAPN